MRPRLLAAFSGQDITVNQISAGQSHCCIVTDEGGVYMWGYHEEDGKYKNANVIFATADNLLYVGNQFIEHIACGAGLVLYTFACRIPTRVDLRMQLQLGVYWGQR